MPSVRTIIRTFSHPPLPRWLSLAVGAGLVAYALYDASQPGRPDSPAALVSAWGIPLADKWVHICGYGAVCLLWCQALIGRDGSGLPRAVSVLSGRLAAVSGRLAARVSGRMAAVPEAESRAWQARAVDVMWAVLEIVLLATAFSAVAELIQLVADQGRSPELEDIVASGLGAGMAGTGFLVCRWV